MEERIVNTKGSAEMRHQLDARRRLPEAPKKSFEPTQMWERYEEVARRIFLGQKNVQIANDLQITPETVSYIRNSDIVQARLRELSEKADDDVVSISNRIKALAPHALTLLEKIVVDGKVGEETIPAKMRAQHAENVLDRAGHAPPKEVRNLNLHTHYTPDDILIIKERARSAGAKSGLIVKNEDIEDAEILEDDDDSQVSYG